MAVKQNTQKTDAYGRTTNIAYVDSTSSRKNSRGQLVLVPNPFRLFRYSAQFHDDFNLRAFATGVIPFTRTINQKAYNKAYASVTRKVRNLEGDAALLVSVASWKSSKKMILNRLKDAHTLLKSVRDYDHAVVTLKAIGNAVRPGYAGSKLANTVASTHLEKIFGWDSLINDIKSSLNVMASPFQGGFITGRGKGEEGSSSSSSYSGRTVRVETDINSSVAISCRFTLRNENTWLLNRLGLLNPLPAVWDVIPWSFVVGMFANVGQVLSSMTSFAGLELQDLSVTETCYGMHDTILIEAPPWYAPNAPEKVARTRESWKEISRNVGGSLPTPRLVVKLPNADLGTILMASALCVTQATRVGRLLKMGK